MQNADFCLMHDFAQKNLSENSPVMLRLFLEFYRETLISFVFFFMVLPFFGKISLSVAIE